MILINILESVERPALFFVFKGVEFETIGSNIREFLLIGREVMMGGY